MTCFGHPRKVRSVAALLCAAAAVLFTHRSFAAEIPEPIASAPWKLEQFEKAPEFEVLSETTHEHGLLQELAFRGPAAPQASAGYTKVFAYYGKPKVAAGTKVPGLVLIHGGGGQAFENWVREANRRGYAAISISTGGRLGDGREKSEMKVWPDEFRGPSERATGLEPTKVNGPVKSPRDLPANAYWTYHAVADGMLAHSLLRSFPDVDADRTGVWGISWGGFTTCSLMGIDRRFHCAVPMYGCGHLENNSAWRQTIIRLRDEWRLSFNSTWDPSNYIPSTRANVFFFNGDQDAFYPLDSWMKCYDLVKSPKKMCVHRALAHGHIWDDRVKPVWNYLAEQLQSGPAIPMITRPIVKEGKVTAEFSATGPVARPRLYYTTGPNSDYMSRDWNEVKLTIDGNLLTGPAPPAEATAWYISLSDTEETKTYLAIASSEVIWTPDP